VAGTYHPVLKRYIDYDELERVGRERLVAQREVERKYRREMARVCLELVGCSMVGVLFMGWAFHVTDRQMGQILLWTGFILGYSGMLLSLARAYLRGEARGDW
jgi:hypothetical protein